MMKLVSDAIVYRQICAILLFFIVFIFTVASTLRSAGAESPNVEVIDESTDISAAARLQPTKAVLFNKFTKVDVNPRFSLLMKPSKPLMKVVPWDSDEKSNCFRLEIKCY